jgi:sec-independent protein translocase protein TatA
MLGELQPWHIIIVLLAFVLLFGSKKLPDTARSLGRSLRMFKSEMTQLREESNPTRTESVTPAAQASPTTSAPASAEPPRQSTETPAAATAEPAREPVVERPRA